MTDISATPGQPLPEFLRFEETLVLNTGVDAETLNPFVFPEDPDEEAPILFKMSQRQFTAILSSVDTGSIISYGAGAMQVYWWFLRNVELSMPFCEQIINCMNTDPDVRNAIIQNLLNDPNFIDGIRDIAGGRGTVNPGEITLPLVEDCDKDVLFGAITNIVESMNRVNEDAFEIMEEATNDEERAVLLVEAIPILNEFIPAELVDIAQQLVENMQENYSAEWTQALADEIRMDLLCIAEKECKITFGMIYDYFSGRIGGSITIGTAVTGAINFLAAGDWPGQQIVNFAFMLQLVALRGGSQFFGVNLYGIELQAALGANNPNNDWTLLEPGDCPDDDTPCVNFDMVTNVGNYYGQKVGRAARKGERITITATGTFRPHPAYPYRDADGHGLPDANFLAQDITQLALMAQIEGEGNRVWHEIGVSGSFVAPISGDIVVNMNEYYGSGPMTATSEYENNDGTFELEVCVEPLPIQLEKTGAGYKLELIDLNDGEPIYEVETVHTGHAVVFSSIEINGTQFYVKHIQVTTPGSPYFTQLGNTASIGLGVGGVQSWWRYNNMPADFVSTVLAMQGVGPGLKLRFTLTTTPGETGELVPYTIGAVP